MGRGLETSLIGILPDTIIPWLLGGLLLLVLVTLSITYKSWCESKRSPYFFLRIQAAKKMQRYLAASAALILVTIATSAYAWQAPADSTYRVALLRYAKPALDPNLTEVEPELSSEASPAAVEINTLTLDDAAEAGTFDQQESLLPSPSLPSEYDQLEPSAQLNKLTTIDGLSFSTDITGDYQALDPSHRFTQGYFTLYATFAYEQMTDGMVWSWVWRRNGDVVDGGNQVWSYGNEGPGYVYLRPEEGFGLGDYFIDIWVNGEQMAGSNFTVIDSISASN